MQNWWNFDNYKAKQGPNEGILSQNFLKENPQAPLYGVVLIVDKSQEWNGAPPTLIKTPPTPKVVDNPGWVSNHIKISYPSNPFKGWNLN